jgi:hypothetical protein
MSYFNSALLSSFGLTIASGAMSFSLLQNPNPSSQHLQTLDLSNKICLTASTATISLLDLKRRR